ncbi:oxidoreductase [Jimgerdemannia flammicorona]|uniref:Oxidoreductase n=1 Tax=Jimgerdemannia flammicorona TaxID=994334 RepID=A0A433Q9S7_9FUNG|nr:oxidoreductase [Jimgerdemannia flammicorona]
MVNETRLLAPFLTLLSAAWLFMVIFPVSLCLAFFELYRRKTPSELQYPQKILITGAASGIGEAIAVLYANSAATATPPRNVYLALLDINPTALERVAETCRARGAQVETHVIDVTDGAAMNQYLLALDTRIGGLDLVHANAGVTSSTLFKGSNPTSIKQRIDSVFSVNGNGCLNTVTPLIEPFKARGRGHFAITASIAAFYLPPDTLGYGASKAMVYRFARDLAHMMRPYGVHVTAICPGFVETNITRQTDEKIYEMSEQQAARIIERGIYNKEEIIAFPRHMYFLTWMVRNTPDCVVGFIYHHLRKPREWDLVG